MQDNLGFWTPRHGFRIEGTGLLILCQWKWGNSGTPKLRIPIVDGISDSLNCIPNSKAQDLTNALKLSKLWSCFQIFAFFCMVGVKEISIITKVLKFTQT